MNPSLDEFTAAYIRTSLWSSIGPRFGTCPCCGRKAILDRFPEEEFTEEAMCSAEGCGVREISNDDPLDANYSPDDLAPAALARIIADCAKFQADNAATLAAAIETGEVKYGPDFGPMGRAGHDFWLTRCGHGAGFWDGDWPEPYGDQLTDAAKAFGNVDLGPGDDGKLYF